LAVLNHVRFRTAMYPTWLLAANCAFVKASLVK